MYAACFTRTGINQRSESTCKWDLSKTVEASLESTRMIVRSNDALRERGKRRMRFKPTEVYGTEKGVLRERGV